MSTYCNFDLKNKRKSGILSFNLFLKLKLLVKSIQPSLSSPKPEIPKVFNYQPQTLFQS